MSEGKRLWLQSYDYLVRGGLTLALPNQEQVQGKNTASYTDRVQETVVATVF